MRKSFIAGNWKMNKTISEAIELVNGLKRELVDFQGADVVVVPPFTALSDVSDLLVDFNIGLGAQDLFWEASGAFTGQVSSVMIKEAGCDYVIIGHSERRKYFSETDDTVNKKAKAALAGELTAIICVGETIEERQGNKTLEVIKTQLEGGLKGLDSQALTGVILAYEPVWAIGTGKTATPAIAEEVHAFIRKWIADNYSKETAQDLRIIYGGSVKPDNAKELMVQPDIDGSLVGGASLDVASFAGIVKNSI